MADEQMADESGWRAADHNVRTDAAAGLMTLWEEAAAEIKRLRAENDRLRAAGAAGISAVDLRTAARVVRSSSWPLDMRPSMDALAARLDQAAAQIDGSGGARR